MSLPSNSISKFHPMFPVDDDNISCTYSTYLSLSVLFLTLCHPFPSVLRYLLIFPRLLNSISRFSTSFHITLCQWTLFHNLLHIPKLHLTPALNLHNIFYSIYVLHRHLFPLCTWSSTWSVSSTIIPATILLSLSLFLLVTRCLSLQSGSQKKDYWMWLLNRLLFLLVSLINYNITRMVSKCWWIFIYFVCIYFVIWGYFLF